MMAAQAQIELRDAMAISVIVADTLPVVRKGMQSWLQKHPEFHITGEAGEGRDIVRMIRQSPPDVLVLDWHLPAGSGPSVLEATRRFARQTRVVVNANYAHEEQVIDVFRKGTLGWILKKCAENEFVKALRTVATRKHFLGQPFSGPDLEDFLKKARDPATDPVDALTQREREVLHLVAEGFTSAAIAARLYISDRTVEMHRARMMRKLNIGNHFDFIRFAVKRGFLCLDDA
jgi:two-component system, NarL family, response regulator NreC